MGPLERRAGLARLELFQGLPPAELDALAAGCTWQSFAPQQQVFDQDSGSGDVYFIVQGRVRVTIYAPNGQEIAFRDLGEGKSFGELAAIDGQSRSASVVALAPTWLASLSRPRFWAMLREHPSVTEQLLKQLASLIRNLTERVVDYSTLGVQNRIQAELVRMAREAGASQNRAVIAPVPRHADIASRISTNREAVARELSRLTRLGIVERGHDSLVVADLARLSAMVDDVRGS
jgi:CRP/FNR family transcriptional regulator, cyclic AMP receptor protein